MKRVLFLLVLSVFVLAVNAQDSISSTIGRFLKNKTQIEGKIIFKKIKSNDTIEYYAFGKDSRKLIYYYTTAKNEKGKNSLTGPRFYFTNNQLIYLYFFLGYLSSKGNGKMAKKAFYEFKNNQLKMKTENNIEPQNIESYIVKSIQILNKSKKIY